jgi:cytochrome c-type biogenesis protein CcmH
MNLKRRFFIALFLGLVFLPVTPAVADSATVGDISDQLICQCGCTLVLSNCTHHECTSREAMTVVIKQGIAQGQSGEQIVQSFVAQYGEQVLSAPPKEGFNLTAWFAPFIALLLGGGVIYVTLRKWVGRGRQSQASTVAEAEEGDEKYRRRLDNELKGFVDPCLHRLPPIQAEVSLSEFG